MHTPADIAHAMQAAAEALAAEATPERLAALGYDADTAIITEPTPTPGGIMLTAASRARATVWAAYAPAAERTDAHTAAYGLPWLALHLTDAGTPARRAVSRLAAMLGADTAEARATDAERTARRARTAAAHAAEHGRQYAAALALGIDARGHAADAAAWAELARLAEAEAAYAAELAEATT